MPLTHVCVWDSKIGYRRITVDKANELYPYEVSARGSQFVCELCAQNVGFSKARVDTGIRYFFHSSAEQNKECEDKEIHLFIPSADYRLPERQGQNKISPCYLDVQSGFIDFSDDSLDGKQGIRKLYYSGFTAKARPDILIIWTRSLHHRRDLRSQRAIQSPKRLQQAQQILSVAISTTGANEVWDTSWKRP